MRSIALGMAIAMLAGCWSPAEAGVKIVARTQTYPIGGGTGPALVAAMDRNGPRHGFMTRAIAQTTYTVDWQFKVKSDDTACRILDASAVLTVTTVVPRVGASMTASLAARWTRFFAGVRKHEQAHGRIASDMVAAAAKAARGVAFANDPSCRQARREAKRRIDLVWAQYEARQVAFDAREHRDGGPVERLVAALVRK